MAKWLEQTKRAKNAMESCDFKWKRDFRVETPFNHKVQGYGAALVHMNGKEARKSAIEKAEDLKMTGDLNITIYTMKTGLQWIVIESGVGKLIRIQY